MSDEARTLHERFILAHHQAAGVQGGTRRSRGGFTTRIHLRVNGAGLPMRSEITPGQTSDCPGFDLVMADNLSEPCVLRADQGYGSDNVRRTMEARNKALCPVTTQSHRASE